MKGVVNMDKFYSLLNASQKKSLSLSLKNVFNEYMDNYNWDFKLFKNKEIIVNDFYFYWLRNSAYRNYSWCEGLKDEFFSESFAREMKKKIRVIIKESEENIKNKTRI